MMAQTDEQTKASKKPGGCVCCAVGCGGMVLLVFAFLVWVCYSWSPHIEFGKTKQPLRYSMPKRGRIIPTIMLPGFYPKPPWTNFSSYFIKTTMTDNELTKKLAKLGYTRLWLDYGILTIEHLIEQEQTFDNSDDQNAGHYRYRTLEPIFKF